MGAAVNGGRIRPRRSVGRLQVEQSLWRHNSANAQPTRDHRRHDDQDDDADTAVDERAFRRGASVDRRRHQVEIRRVVVEAIIFLLESAPVRQRVLARLGIMLRADRSWNKTKKTKKLGKITSP